MPFRPENIMTTILIIAVLLLVLMGIIGAVTIAIWGGEKGTPPLVYILGASVLSVKVLLGMIQTEMARRDLKETAGRAADKAEEAAEKVSVAQRDIMQKVNNAAATARDTNEKVHELYETHNGSLEKSLVAMGEQVRAAEHDLAADTLLNNPAFAEMLRRMAAEAAQAVARTQGAK